MFVVAGVTGHTGKVVANTLLAAGKKVRVIVRDAAKAKSFAEAGAEVAVADNFDVAAITKALQGAEGAYVLLPPDATSTDFVARGHKIADTYAAAIRESRVPHVVLLSSVGAQHVAGTGPIKTVNYAETLFRKIEGTKFTFLRAAYFMENHLNNLHPMKENGVLPAFGGGEAYPFAQVATKDIGEVAADALLHAPATTQIIELEGPAPRSLNDAAAVFGKLLGREVTATALPIDTMVPTLSQYGFSADVAAQYREMNEAMGKGLLTFEGGNAKHVRGKVTLEEFAKAAISQ